MALLDGLIALWPLDGNANAKIGSQNGTPTDVTWATGHIHQCASMNGSSSYIDLGRLTAIEGLSQFTFAIWHYADGWDGTYRYLFEYSDGSNTFNVRRRFWGSRYLYASLSDGSGTLSVSSGGGSIGSWLHIIVTFNAGELSLYLNNSLLGSDSGSVAGIPAMPSGVAYLGCGYNQEYGWIDGDIEQIPFWNRVLTSSERAELYNSGAGIAYPFGSIEAGHFISHGALTLGGYTITAIPVGHFSSQGALTAAAYETQVPYFYATVGDATIRKVIDSPYQTWSKAYSEIDANYTYTDVTERIATDNAGNLYAIGQHDDKIHKLDSDGNLLWTFAVAVGSATRIGNQ